MSIVSPTLNMSNAAEIAVPQLDWSDKNTNDVITAMLTRLPLLRWLELSADWPDGFFYHPDLAVNKFLRIDFETLQRLLGGGSLWGSGIEWNGSLFRATGATRLQRSVGVGSAPVFIFLDPSGIGPRHPFQGPGQLVAHFHLRSPPVFSHAPCLFHVFFSGDVWPGGGGRGSVAALWRRGNFRILSPEDRLTLREDLRVNNRGRYGLPPPPGGWTAAGFAAEDPRPRDAAVAEEGARRSSRGLKQKAAAPAEDAAAGAEAANSRRSESTGMVVDETAAPTSRARPRDADSSDASHSAGLALLLLAEPPESRHPKAARTSDEGASSSSSRELAANG